MKTSSLIVTFNDMLTTGGHNLSSRISRVNKMTGYKQTRGGYTPTDYPQENEKEKMKKENEEPTTKVSPNKPNGSKPATTTAKKKSSNSSNHAVKQSSNHSVRSRSSVISSAPRKTRGL